MYIFVYTYFVDQAEVDKKTDALEEIVGTYIEMYI